MLVTFEAKKPNKSRTSVQRNTNSSPEDGPIIHNLDSENPPDAKIFSFTKRKSKGGCITCKIRKKRCSEERPICSDCKRLGKNCVWASDDMSAEHVRELKRKVEEDEKDAKTRKREDKKDRKRPRKPQESDTMTPFDHEEEQQQVEELEESDPLDTESQHYNQTPVSANLLHFPQRSVSSPPRTASPAWDQFAEQFQEFQHFFESNIRQNYPKIVPIDDDDSKDVPKDNNNRLTTRTNTALSPFNIDSFFSNSPISFDIPQYFSPMPHELIQDPIAVRLYDYYRDRLAGIMSIVPDESNYYTKVFLPMATVNKGVLYSIMAWAGYHMGGDFEREGSKYMEKALDYIKATPIKTDSDALQRLANLLIMCGAEICKGDVKKWPVFLQWGSKIIRDRGGLYKFNQDKEQHWLISSFAYHDILASSTSERGTYFSVEDYDNFIVNFGFGVDPLQGIVKPLFNIIGEISTLATEAKRLLKISSNSLGYGIMNDEDDDDKKVDHDTDVPGIDTPDSVDSDSTKKYTKYSSLLQIMQKASNMENKINNVKPDPEDLGQFTNEELELQLTLFELFQLTAKLHLRQSVLRLNPSSLETQFILCELLKCLDIVLKSSVESSLCFPLFIAGMNCTTKKDRRMMLERFNDIIQRYSFRNLERAKTVMEQVWMIDPSGTRCVDWYEIVKRLGWDLSFA
jgi:transcriptional activator protein UGA3